MQKYKDEYKFRLFVDDAHGFGTVGENGRGAGDHQGCHDQIDVYFGTFAKAMATIGAFVAGDEDVIEFLRYNMRSNVCQVVADVPRGGRAQAPGNAA